MRYVISRIAVATLCAVALMLMTIFSRDVLSRQYDVPTASPSEDHSISPENTYGANVSPNANYETVPLPVFATDAHEAFVPIQSDVPVSTQSAYNQQPMIVAEKSDLIELYWWMIYSGSDTASLTSLTLDADSISDVSEKFSNYLTGYNYDYTAPSITVSFKTGIKALHAIERGKVDELDYDTQYVALRAQAAVNALIDMSMSDFDKEAILHDYVVDNCEYALDDDANHAGDAMGFYGYGACRCAGYVDTFRLLARLVGLDVEMIGGDTTRDLPGEKGHAWNLIRLAGQWYVVDLTWDDRIGVTGTEHTFFNLPLGAFGNTRNWDADCLPAGNYAREVDGLYYYAHEGMTAGTADDALTVAERQFLYTDTAYLYFVGDISPSTVAEKIADRYQSEVRHSELSQDINIDVYRFDI